MAVRLAAAAVLGGARARPSIPRLMCAGTANNRLFSSPPRDPRGHCPDYYAVLGLNRAATPRQVKVAYFKRAKKYHPDQNQSDEARLMFQLVAEAYEVLSDERRRRNFDEHGTPGERFGGTTSVRGGPGRARGPDNYDPEELFSKIFGEASEELHIKLVLLPIIQVCMFLFLIHQTRERRQRSWSTRTLRRTPTPVQRARRSTRSLR